MNRDGGHEKRRRGRRIVNVGLRAEVLILIPVSMLLLALLAVFSLFGFRDAIERTGEERRDEALQLARRVAEMSSTDSLEPLAALRELAPGLRSLAIYGSDLRRRSDLAESAAAPESIPQGWAEATAFGPSAELPSTVVAIAPAREGADRRWVRVELGASTVGAARRTLVVLTPLLLGVTAALTILVTLFVRPLLAPYDALLHTARQAGLLSSAESDEIAALIAGFEGAVSSHHRPASALAAAEQSLTEELQAGLMLAGPQGEVLALNATGSRILGVRHPQIGQPVEEVLAELPQLAALVRQAVGNGEPIDRAEVAIGGVTDRQTLGVAIHALRRGEGSPRGYLVLFSDLTRFERLAAEQRLNEGLAQLGELAAGVAHELRNSLGVLRGYVELSADETDPRALLSYRQEIEAETTRLQQVVDDFLAFARPGAIRLDPMDLAEVLARVARDVAPGAQPAALFITPPPRMHGDAVLLERAFRNLLRNAGSANSESGSREVVRVSLGPTSGGWEVRIEDRGPGVPEAIRSRLFQPFVSSRPGGTGLGLALARRVVAMHRGSLRLDDREGGGTCAVVEFPRDAFVTHGNARPTE